MPARITELGGALGDQGYPARRISRPSTHRILNAVVDKVLSRRQIAPQKSRRQPERPAELAGAPLNSLLGDVAKCTLFMGRKRRVPIEPTLAAQVLFASDRTCCVCRNPTRKTEIHHIDEDPSNNDFANLAVVCKDCQSEAHTTHAFARNLTPQLITLYNESWRSLVSDRLERRIDDAKKSLQYRALHDIWGLANVFLQQLWSAAAAHGHEWIENDQLPERYRRTLNVIYSPENWAAYLPLFAERVPILITKCDRFHTLYQDVLTYTQRNELMYFVTLLDTERGQYLGIPHYPLRDKEAAQDSLFRVRFAFVHALAKETNDKFIGYANEIFPPT